MNGHEHGIDYANQEHIDRERQEAIELQEFYGRYEQPNKITQQMASGAEATPDGRFGD